MTPEQARAFAEPLLRDHVGPDWRLVIDNRAKRRLGQCRYIEREIGVSAWLLEAGDDEVVKDTILHEVAHAMTPGADHGARWKAACIKLGASPERCASREITKRLKKPRANFVAKCELCGQTHRRFRTPRRQMWCKCIRRRGLKYPPEYALNWQCTRRLSHLIETLEQSGAEVPANIAELDHASYF